MSVGLTHFLVLSTALLGLGLYGVLVRHHALAILMSAELMLGASVLALAAFARFTYQPARPLAGQAVAIFVIGVALVQALVGTALALALLRQRDSMRQQGVPPTSAARDRIE